MKKLSVSLLALMAALVAAPVAHADSPPGWYLGAGVGADFGINHDMRSATGTHEIKDKDVDLDVLGSVGYGFDSGIRLEGEYFHDQKNNRGINGGYPNPSGHVTDNAIFMNALYDFHTGTMWTPYVGAGVGPDFVNVKNVGASGIGHLRGDTLVGAYQGIAGVAAQLDRNWAVTADYRYIASLDPKVDSTAGGQGRLENSSHNLVLGVRYSFDQPEAPVAPMHTAVAPMVAPHTAAKPMVAGVSQNFMVFFDFNKSTLTPEAKRIIASAAQEFKRGGYAKIDVTGHTDTVGSAGYNQKLSNQRALAVEAELTKLGVASKNIKESGVGKDGLMVPTADGVREAQNRRAEIVLAK